jgi:hypothetical protein
LTKACVLGNFGDFAKELRNTPNLPRKTLEDFKRRDPFFFPSFSSFLVFFSQFLDSNPSEDNNSLDERVSSTVQNYIEKDVLLEVLNKNFRKGSLTLCDNYWENQRHFEDAVSGKSLVFSF